MSGTFNPVVLPDFGATWQRGQAFQQHQQQNALAMLQAQRQMEDEQNYSNMLQKPGMAEGLSSADPTVRGNSLAAMYRSGPRGAQQAMPMMQQDRYEAQLNGPAAAPAAAPQGAAPVRQAAAPADRDLDLVARTLIGEAGNQGPQGMAAVAHVIANRTRQSGMAPGQVVTAPGQFEPWQTRRDQLLAIDPQSPQYQQALGIARSVLTGQAQDPTGGADHFYAPQAQAALGRQAPAWAQGDGQDIGGHRFFRVGYQAPGGGGAPPTQPAAAGGLPAVPGFDMARVARAQQLAATNPRAAAYWQSYLQTAQLMKREDATTTAAPGSAILRNGQVVGHVPPEEVREETRDISGVPTQGQVRNGVFTPYPSNTPPGMIRRDGRLVNEPGGPQEAEGRSRDFTNTRQLREEFNGTQAAKDYAIVRPNYQAIQRAAGTDSRAADIDMVFAFAKMLDPNSVVREGEQITLMRTGGVFDTVGGWISGLSGGGRLTPDVRAAIKAQAESRFGIAADAHDERLDYYSGLAREGGFSPGSIGRPSDRTPARPPGQAAAPVVTPQVRASATAALSAARQELGAGATDEQVVARAREIMGR